MSKHTRKTPSPTRVTGTYSAHPRGFGFIDLDKPMADGTDSAFVPPRPARDLLDGDLVVADVTSDDRGAAVDTVVSATHRRRWVVGTSNNGRLDLDPQLGKGWIALPGKHGRGVMVVLVDEDLDVTEVVAGPVAADHPDAARMQAVVRAADPDGLGGAHADAQLRRLIAGQREADASVRRRVTGAVPGRDLPRRDVTATATVTVDGPTTRDLDDAVSANVRPDGTVRVAVHIADVAGAVGAGSALDARARDLATSVYLAEHTDPMLPRDLSEGALSLVPDVERDTVTVEFTVGRDGRVSDVEPYLSRIRSGARLTYRRVQQHLDGRRLGGDAGRVVSAMCEAAAALGRDRANRDTTDGLFSPADRRVSVADGAVVVTDAEPYAAAMGVIERLMVAANESVAGWLAERDVPSLYRVHAGINPRRAGLLRSALADAGVDVDEVEVAGFSARAIFDAATGTDSRRAAAIEQGAADAMGRAGYSTSPDHHCGLDSRPYTHFTSPIRRYCDLVVHRQLRAALAGEDPVHHVGELDEIAAWIEVRSGMSARAEALENSLLWGQWCAAEIAAGRRRAVDVTVRKVTPAGLVVRVGEFGLGAFVAAETLPNKVLRRGRLEVASDALADASGTYRIGSSARATLRSVDETGRLELADASRR